MDLADAYGCAGFGTFSDTVCLRRYAAADDVTFVAEKLSTEQRCRRHHYTAEVQATFHRVPIACELLSDDESGAVLKAALVRSVFRSARWRRMDAS